VTPEDKQNAVHNAFTAAMQFLTEIPGMKEDMPLGGVMVVQFSQSEFAAFVIAKMDDARIQLKIIDNLDSKMRKEFAAQKVKLNSKRGTFGSDAE
jgi:hypothetical protein